VQKEEALPEICEMLKNLYNKKAISVEDLGFIAHFDEEIREEIEVRLKEIKDNSIKL
jgi:hypothetical protein